MTAKKNKINVINVLCYSRKFDVVYEEASKYLGVSIIAHEVKTEHIRDYIIWTLEAFHDRDQDKVKDYVIGFYKDRYRFGFVTEEEG